MYFPPFYTRPTDRVCSILGIYTLILLLFSLHRPAIADDALFASLTIQIDRFKINGQNPLSAKETRVILDNYLGEHQGIEGIEAAANDLENAFKKAGFAFFRVHIPAQSVKTGTIQLEVVRLPLGHIHVSGNQHFSTENILNSVPELQHNNTNNTPVDLQKINRQLNIANRNRAKNITLKLTTDEEQERINGTLHIQDYKPIELSVFANNAGDDSTGDYRTGITFQHNNLFHRDHGLSVSYILSPTESENVDQYGGNYRIPLYRLGDELNFSTWKSNFNSLTDLKGAAEIYSIGFTHFLPKSQDYQQHIILSVQDKLFETSTTVDGVSSDSDVRSRPIALKYHSTLQTSNADTNFFIGYRNNLSGGSNNDQTAYETVKTDAKQNWSAITFGTHIEYFLPKSWLLHATADGQMSHQSLIIGEQFGLGGFYSLAGFTEFEVLGDEGYQAKLELFTPRLYKDLRLFGSYEVGHVTRNAILDGQATSERVSSMSLGISGHLGKKCTMKIQAAYVLDGVDDVSEGDSRTQNGNSRAHFYFACNLL